MAPDPLFMESRATSLRLTPARYQRRLQPMRPQSLFYLDDNTRKYLYDFLDLIGSDEAYGLRYACRQTLIELYKARLSQLAKLIHWIKTQNGQLTTIPSPPPVVPLQSKFDVL
jgi:hypothetical protein